MLSKRILHRFERVAGEVVQKTHSYASAGKERVVTTLQSSRDLVREKKSGLRSIIRKEKRKFWH